MAGINKINSGMTNLHREPVNKRVERRNPEFSQRLKSAVLEVNDKQHIADDSVEAVIQGRMGIHEGMLALGKASTTLKVLAQVRNKAMTAYNEIMRMQV
ncbi:MAG: flagellar hook-basal body complex protein FliE [Desulfobacter sp.]|nr:MAG: flagellar hook-basal body complex protein FliE [Desulfobacter sp.]